MAEIAIVPDRPKLIDRLKSSYDGWFNPGKPIAAVAPAGTEPRQIDFTQSQNLNWTPRAYEPIGFAKLRMFADNCYLMRVIIEKMKDRICSKTYHFRLKPKPGEYEAMTKERSNEDPRIAQLSEFFIFPDSINSWKKWLRMVLEDRLVIDAASLEVQRTRDNRIYNLSPVDGATINVLIDETGRRPHAPLPAYRQIIKGLPAIDFSAGVPVDDQRQLVYMPANVRAHKLYGYSPVEQTLQLMMLVIYKTVFHLDFWAEGDLPLAQMPIPETMSITDAMRLMREIQARLTGDLAERNKILPVFGGGKIEVIKHEPFDVKFEEWAARVFCYVIGEPATGFVQQNNRATAQQQDDSREESGEQPVMLWVKDELDAMIQRPDLFNAADIEFIWDEQAETDALKQAQIDQINVAIGTRVADELRGRDGLSPLWEDSGGNPPQPSMMVSNEEEQDDPGATGGDDKSSSDSKVPNTPPKKKVSKAAQKKTLKIDPAAFTKARRAATDKVDAALKAFFFTQRHAVSLVIAPHLSEAEKAAANPDPDAVLNSIDWEAWSALIPIFEQQLEDTGKDAIATVFATLNLEADGDFFKLANTYASDYAHARAAELVGKKWMNGVLVDNPKAEWAITQTTREQLRELITQAFADKWSPTELAKQIDSAFAFSVGRATMIAETETAMALTDATVKTGIEAGATTKSTQMSNLHDIDDECDEAEQAGEVAIDAPYPSGALHVPLHPRCRCVELLHIAKESK
jgi:hypothetical protein